MPNGMAIRTVTISEVPISRTVGQILSAMIELTDVFCLKLSAKVSVKDDVLHPDAILDG